jgi:hypothetical protein
MQEQSSIEAAKAAQARERFRLDLERKLRECADFHDPQFNPADIDDLVSHVMRLPIHENAKSKMLKNWKIARQDKATYEKAIAAAGRWGHGKRPDGVDPPELMALKTILTTIEVNIAYYAGFLGKGKTPGKFWHYYARVIGKRVLKALQSADRAAGRPIRTGYTEPMIDLIGKLLAPLCEQVGEVLTPHAVRIVLQS